MAEQRIRRRMASKKGPRPGPLERYRRVAGTVRELTLGRLDPAGRRDPGARRGRCRREHGGKRGGRIEKRGRKGRCSSRNYSKVHGKGVEPLRLAAAEPKSAASASFATRAVCFVEPSLDGGF